MLPRLVALWGYLLSELRPFVVANGKKVITRGDRLIDV